jgi:tetratricopeptide (TPR) repeat protein
MSVLRVFERPPDSAVVARARPAVEKALALDPNLSDAHVSLALIRQLVDWDWKGSEHAFRRALELDPSNWEAHYEYGQLLKRLARPEEALAEMQCGLALDPLSPMLHQGVIQALGGARRYDEAIKAAERALQLHPNDPMFQLNYAGALENAGKSNEADEAWKRYYTLCCRMNDAEYEHLPLTRFRRYVASGQQNEALGVVRGMEAAYPAIYSAYDLGRHYAQLGDRNQALRWLERSVETREVFIINLIVHPELDSLRGEPRFLTLLKKVGLDQ